MGKAKAPKTSILRTAANLRATYRKWLILLACGVAVCVIVIFAYMSLVGAGVIPNVGIAAWIIAVIAAGFLGWFGNKFTRTHREYEAFLDARRISNWDVVEFVKNNQGK